jgi:hypothetical protein
MVNRRKSDILTYPVVVTYVLMVIYTKLRIMREARNNVDVEECRLLGCGAV